MNKLLFLMMLLLTFPLLSEEEPRKNDNLFCCEYQVGKAKLKYLFWDIYNATLYTKEKEFSFDKPFVLSLEYLRDLKGEEIAKRSITEIKEQGYRDVDKMDEWLIQLKEIIPDIKKGDVIKGISNADKETTFYFNDKPIGKIKDPEFTEKFFNIWLSEKTSQPKMRLKLLGLK